MSLRQRLALGFLLFSALPLAGFAVFSYLGARSALRAAAQSEAEIAARDLERRVGRASEEIASRFRTLSELPLTIWVSENADDPHAASVDTALAGLGPALRYVEQLRFVPAPAPAAPNPPVAAVPPVPPAPASAVVVSASTIAARETERALAALERAAAGKGDAPPALAKAQAAALREELSRVRQEIAATLEHSRRVEVRVPAPASGSPSAAAAAAPVAKAVHVKGAQALAAGTIDCPLTEGDRVLGKLEAKVKGKELLHSVLREADRETGEIPFVLDGESQLYAASEEDSARLAALPAVSALRGMPASTGKLASSDWIVLARQDPATGFRFGIAHPVGGAIAELRAMTARNLFFGAGLVAVTLLGFFPLTGPLVRDVRKLERGADAIAAGDLAARVDIRRGDEVGRLGRAFNNMAAQLADHRDQLLAEERRRKEDEIARRLLAAENERRGRELEEAREFQLALLPRELPRLPDVDLAVDMTTATEVGGDYYDFQSAPDGALVVAIGDATGHGAAAGTMVTAVKSLFAATAASQPPAEFLAAANAAIHRMGLVRRAMALSVARVAGREVVLSAAGMPPLLHYRAGEDRVDEVALPGTPLGARAEFPYGEARLEIRPGDALLMLSDGLPELPNHEGEPYGYERLRARFGELARTGDCAAAMVEGLRGAVREWGGGSPPVDDVTLLVLAARRG